jgi:L-fuculose-phosphate aldolase
MNIKNEIVTYAHLMYQKEYSVASEGNISYRLDKDRVVITPSNLIKCFLTEDDLVEINMQGELTSGTRKPTTEKYTHLEIYKERPEIKAIVHAHPFYTILLNSLGITPFDKVFLSEAVMFLNDVAFSDFARPSTKEGAKVINEICKHTNIIILDRHGAVTYADNLHTAFSSLEIMEKYAKMYYHAHFSDAKIRYLSEEQIAELKKVEY